MLAERSARVVPAGPAQISLSCFSKHVEEVMIVCDLCEETKECFERQIEGKKYDICADCWEPLAMKLKGKGRVSKEREIVLLPGPSPQTEPTEPKPLPGHPPKIWGGAGSNRLRFGADGQSS